MSNEIYNRLLFKRFFEKEDPSVLTWAENVLEKIKSPGILPVFLNKDNNPDFDSFWSAISHLFALIVLYARKYNEIDVNKILFNLFIESRGLITNDISSEEQMQYLFYNYLEEYKKRGKLDIINKEGTLLGELLRLIRYNDINEFIFGLINNTESGWTLSKSSPTWRRTDTVLSVNKGYENTKDVLQLSNYPLINPTAVVTIDDRTNEVEPIKSMTFYGDSLIGISGEENTEKIIKVSQDLSYQISFKIKLNGDVGESVKFGVDAYDDLYRSVNLLEASGDTESNYFTPDGNISVLQYNTYYEFRAIIFEKDSQFYEQVPLNFLNGRALRFKEQTTYISLHLTQDRSLNQNQIYIYDIKIKPLDLTFKQGYLGDKGLIAMYFQNNSLTKEDYVKSYSEQYLISNKNILTDISIHPIEVKTLKFKVFSDRRTYIEGVKIIIDGNEYFTDINGEVDVQIKPGNYIFSAEKDLFFNWENELLEVDEEELQIVFIRLEGELYERNVIFQIRDNDSMVPIQGAIITFNQRSYTAGVDGNVNAKAFPGLYSYRATHPDYYSLNKSVRVIDDIVEQVLLRKIPKYNLSFIVKYTDPTTSAVTMVQGAMVTITGQGHYDTINREITTDNNGQANFGIMESTMYNYTVEKAEWLPVTGQVNLTQDSVIEIDFSPIPTYNINILVLSYNSYTKQSTPLQGASVTFAGSVKTTGTDGTAQYIVKQGNYSYNVTASRHTSQSGELFINSDTEQQITLNQIDHEVLFRVKGDGGMILQNTTITIGDQIKTTNERGEVTFNLPNGDYSYTAVYNEYHTLTGTFTVSDQNQIIDLQMIQKLYNITFTVQEEGLISVGARITIGSQSLTTDVHGQVVFQLPNGSYRWVCEKSLYISQNGNINVNSQPSSYSINLIKKSSKVTFVVFDDKGVLVGGAFVSVGTQSGNTDSSGRVSFDLKVGNYIYDASKAPDYNSVRGNFTVGEEDQEIRIVLSNKEYNLVLKAVRQGTIEPIIPNAIYTVNGVTNITGSFMVRQGNYTATVTAPGYEPAAKGNIQVDERYVPPTFVEMIPAKKQVTVTVIKDGQNAPNINVEYKTYLQSGGEAQETLTVQTNSSGEAFLNVPQIGGYIAKVATNECITVTTDYLTGNTTIRIMTALIVRSRDLFSAPHVELDHASVWENTGDLFKYQGNPLRVKFGVNAIEVTQWPVYFDLVGTSLFDGASNLSRLATNAIPRFVESLRKTFDGTINLTDYPPNLFSRTTAANVNDASRCFRNSGIQKLYNSTFPNNFYYFFEVCRGSKLREIQGTPFGYGTYFHNAFRQTTQLTTVSETAFIRCRGGGIYSGDDTGTTEEDFGSIFEDSAINNIPIGLFYDVYDAYSFNYAFQNTKITNVPTGELFGSGQKFIGTFARNPLLTEVRGYVFPPSAWDLSYCFYMDSALINVEQLSNANIGYRSSVSVYDYAFAETSIQNFPLLKGNKVQANYTFQNCKNAIFNRFEFWEMSPTSMVGCFKGCTSLIFLLMYEDGVSDNFLSITNMNEMFNGCRQLTRVLHYKGEYFWNVPSLASVPHNAMYRETVAAANVPSGWK